jgi:Tfp pilus assembly protein PilN
MPSINMIAARRAERKKLEKTIRTTMLVILGQIVLAVGLFSFMTARVCSAGRKLSDLDQELKRIQPTVNEIRHYEAEIKKLTPRLDLLADSREETLLWHSLLRGVSRSMPKNTWLSSLQAKVPEKTETTASAQAGTEPAKPPALSVNLKGISTSQSLVGETMLRLNQCPEIEKVNLSYTQKGSAVKDTAIEFEIVAELKADEPQKGGKVTNADN